MLRYRNQERGPLCRHYRVELGGQSICICKAAGFKELFPTTRFHFPAVSNYWHACLPLSTDTSAGRVSDLENFPLARAILFHNLWWILYHLSSLTFSFLALQLLDHAEPLCVFGKARPPSCHQDLYSNDGMLIIRPSLLDQVK